MATNDRYIVVDSSAYTKYYPANVPLKFTNKLHVPINNWFDDLEMAVVEVYVQDLDVRQICNLGVYCDAVEPYQYGEDSLRLLHVFYASNKELKRVRVEDFHKYIHPIYRPVERGVWENLTMEMVPLFPHLNDTPVVAAARVCISLHVRSNSNLNKEAKNIFQQQRKI